MNEFILQTDYGKFFGTKNVLDALIPMFPSPLRDDRSIVLGSYLKSSMFKDNMITLNLTFIFS